MTEPRVVVAHREQLWWLLAEAAQLEHMIMCQYLYAEFSLKDGTDGLTGGQAEAVGRWRKTLHEIAVEEMLHLALVSNLMTAIGAAPVFGRPNFPQRSGYFPAGVQLDLLPFGEQALRHFLLLERPEGMERQDAAGFVPAAPPREPVQPGKALPQGQEFATIGHLYRGIADGLGALAARCGERAVFVGSPHAQATPELLGWPQLIAVTDLASALAAVEEIIEQGEGCAGDWRTAHYGRFLSMWQEYRDRRQRDPSFQPARPVLPSYTRQPFGIAAPQPVITDPLTHQVAELAAMAYELVLQLLNRFFTRTDETGQQLQALIGAAITMMAGVLRPLAAALTTLPAGPPHDGRTAGFSFEVYYVLGNIVPWREPAWALLHERTALLAIAAPRPPAPRAPPAPSRKPASARPPSPPLLPTMYPPTCAHDLPGPGRAPVPDSEEAFIPTTEQNKDTVSTFAREVFGNKNLDYAGTWLADDFVEHQVFPGTTPDKKGALDFYRIFFAASPDMTAEIHDMVAAGDKVAIRATYRGTDSGGFIPGAPATGKSFAMDAIYLVRINEQGQIAEHWGVVDTIGTMGELGLLPAPDQAPPA